MPVTVPVVGSVKPVGVVYVPLPLTVTVSVSTGVVPPLWNSVKVIVPVGLKPPASVAVSVKVTALGPSVTVVGMGAVVSVVPAAGTSTGSSPRAAGHGAVVRVAVISGYPVPDAHRIRRKAHGGVVNAVTVDPVTVSVYAAGPTAGSTPCAYSLNVIVPVG